MQNRRSKIVKTHPIYCMLNATIMVEMYNRVQLWPSLVLPAGSHILPPLTSVTTPDKLFPSLYIFWLQT